MIIINCIYQEFQPETYQGMGVRVLGHDNRYHLDKKFFTANPVADYWNAVNYAKQKYRGEVVMTSSTVDNYFMEESDEQQAIRN